MRSLVLAVCLLSACSYAPLLRVHESLPSYGDSYTGVFQEYEPFVMLANSEGRAYCSGTVLDINYVLTAAHCVSDADLGLRTDAITILSNAKHDTGVRARAVAMSIVYDLAIVRGDFRRFQTIPIDTTGFPFRDKSSYMACGFPHLQSHVVCGQIGNAQPYQHKYTAWGQLVTGMSGGPVLRVGPDGSMAIVGVNNAVNGGIPSRPASNIIISSTLGLLGLFDIE